MNDICIHDICIYAQVHHAPITTLAGLLDKHVEALKTAATIIIIIIIIIIIVIIIIIICFIIIIIMYIYIYYM